MLAMPARAEGRQSRAIPGSPVVKDFPLRGLFRLYFEGRLRTEKADIKFEEEVDLPQDALDKVNGTYGSRLTPGWLGSTST